MTKDISLVIQGAKLSYKVDKLPNNAIIIRDCIAKIGNHFYFKFGDTYQLIPKGDSKNREYRQLYKTVISNL